MKFIGRNCAPESLVADIQSGEQRWGLSDGSWSLVDLLDAAATRCGAEATLHLAVWTASGDHAGKLVQFVEQKRVRAVNMIVDRSFKTRQPEACERVIECFGEGAIRVWSCHAKFAIFEGGDLPLMLQFSANLNQNKRIENFNAIAVPSIIDEYIALVADLWSVQGDGTGFSDPKAGRRATEELLGEPETPSIFDGSFDFDLPDFSMPVVNK